MTVASIYSTPRTVEHPSELMTGGLAAAVEAALWSYAPFRLAASEVRISADDGRIALEGTTATAAQKAVAEAIACGVAGVTSVDNRLVADSELEGQVALALYRDRSLALTTDSLEIKCLRGVVFLGPRPAADGMRPEVLARARQVVGVLPGVRGVVTAAQNTPAAASPAPDAGHCGGGAGPGRPDRNLAERLRIWRDRAEAARE
jgi:hypothetical protein